MRGLSLFSGIGGLDLAFEWAGGTVSAMCELDPFCQKVLRKHWPEVPLFGDIREVRGKDVGTVNVIFGGFPCQPFSVAGYRKGQSDPRHLWPEFSRLVGEIRPRWVVAENVPGILSIAADDVCLDLEHLGYSVGIWNFEAAAVGAPHRRARTFFVAHAGCGLLQGDSIAGAVQGEHGARQTPFVERSGSPSAAGEISSNPKGRLRDEFPITKTGEHQGCFEAGRLHRSYTHTHTHKQENSQEFKPGMGRVANGFSPWLDGDWEGDIARVAYAISDRGKRLRTLGNAVVPQQAYPVFKAIFDAEKGAKDEEC